MLIEEMEYATPTRYPHDAAPRIVPQPPNQGIWKPPLPFVLMLYPANLIWKLLSSSFSIVGWLFPFLPRLLNSISNSSRNKGSGITSNGRRPLNPKDTAARFIREFGEEFGEHSLKFYENGYAQAYDLAKKDLKFLVVVILSPEHDNTAPFVRDVLLSQEVSSFLNNPENNIILWAGNVQDSEAYQVACGLSCTKFPFSAMIVHIPQDSSTAMSTVARIVGSTTPNEFMTKLRDAVSHHAPPLERVRAQRREQEATRNLRQQQESAYERSLAQDRERTRLRREAEAAKTKEEQEAKSKTDKAEKEAQQLLQWKRWKASNVSPEPSSDVKDATRLSIRLASGERIVRRFHPRATVEDIYAFVECQDVMDDSASSPVPPIGYKHEYNFRLVSPLPRAVYNVTDGGMVGDKIGRSGNLIVESTKDVDEDI